MKRIIKIGLGIIALGIVCLILKAITGSYLDENGILHEYFFLLPIGFGMISVGIIVCIVGKLKR